MAEKKTCIQCNKELSENLFFMNKNKERIEICRECMLKKYDMNDQDSVMELCKYFDVPFLKYKWIGYKAKYPNDVIFGKYLATMKLRQTKDLTYKDSDMSEQNPNKVLELPDEAEIEQLMEAEDNKEKKHKKTEEELKSDEKKADEEFKKQVEFSLEEIEYLKKKWGKGYTLDQYISLERFWIEMNDSYDIITATHKDYSKKICKLSLQLDIAFRAGDINEQNSIVNQYDKMMKSANFTESQKKDKYYQGITSIGEIIGVLEKKGFIPQFYVTKPNDRADEVMDLLNESMRQLVYGEEGLTNLIDSSVEKMKEEQEELERLAEMEKDREEELENNEIFQEVSEEEPSKNPLEGDV